MNACTLNPTDSANLDHDYGDELIMTSAFLRDIRRSMVNNLTAEQRQDRLNNLKRFQGKLQHLESEFHNFELLSLVQSLEETAEDLINTDSEMLNSILCNSSYTQHASNNTPLHNNAPKMAS